MSASEIVKSNLSLVLPPRAGRKFAQYLESIEAIFQEIVQENPQQLLNRLLSQDVVVFSPAETDSGKLCSLYSVSPEMILLRFNNVWPRSYQDETGSLLVTIGSGSQLYAFFAKVLQVSENILMLTVPVVIYHRAVRHFSRIPLTESLQVFCKDGLQLQGKTADFSPTGIRFFMPAMPIHSKEKMLLEFATGECGSCETIVQVVRSEPLTSGTRCQVAVKMLLTGFMKRKMEYLYWCCQKTSVNTGVTSS